ncbi:MAG TPA: DUF255 domain-containing protein [Gammaproteobacteria bacterium]|nr:DUF255 domain-containing protein [Gammaproteobacteria bacterium]
MTSFTAKMAHMLIAAIVMAGSAAANELSEHDSPYLAMHGDGPVAWHTWSAEALEKGRGMRNCNKGRLITLRR